MFGRAPAGDEIEVTLFGPGYGEAIAVHIGCGRWVLVDSCLEPNSSRPASLYYLSEIGVSPDSVRAVIASHWHDDHVRGISALSKACRNATFYLSGVFNDQEAMAFLSAYGGEVAAAQTRGTKELYSVITTCREPYFAYQRTLIYEDVVGGRTVRILAFSPTQTAQARALAHMLQYVPSLGNPINHAPELSPNLEAVVIHIDFGVDSVLLGSDLENQGKFGWHEILNDAICRTRPKASIYKVAHHGSATGDTPRIWSDLLVAAPIAALTPFNNGSVYLPTPADTIRIKKASRKAFLSSNAKRKASLPRELNKRMSHICRNLRQRNTEFGAVRARKQFAAPDWQVELFGRAKRI